MHKRSLREWIKENRTELDSCIRRALDDNEYKLNDRERRMWVENDEGLYNWARADHVNLGD